MPRTKPQTDTLKELLMNTVQHLAANVSDISLRSLQRSKSDLKESVCWTYIYQVDTKMTSNE